MITLDKSAFGNVDCVHKKSSTILQYRDCPMIFIFFGLRHTNLHRWGLAKSAFCEPRQAETAESTKWSDTHLLTKSEGRLQLLHDAQMNETTITTARAE